MCYFDYVMYINQFSSSSGISRASHLRQKLKLKNPLPLSFFGDINIGTWFLWVILIYYLNLIPSVHENEENRKKIRFYVNEL